MERERTFASVVRREVIVALVPVCLLLGVGLAAIAASANGYVVFGGTLSLAATWVALVYKNEIYARGDRAGNFLIGRESEQKVESLLDPLSERGWFVTHDVPLPFGGNIDHVVCGPVGAFMIETKTRSYIPSDLPKARLHAKWLSDRLGGVWVTPVICLVARDREPFEPSKVAVMGAAQLRPWLESRRGRAVDPPDAARRLGR